MTARRGWSARRRAAHYAAYNGNQAHDAIALARRLHDDATAAVFIDLAGRQAADAFHWAAVALERAGQVDAHRGNP